MVIKNNHIIKENKEDKALVKSIEEILNIKNTYMTYIINVSFGDDYSDVIKDLIDTYKADIDFDSNEDYLPLDPDEIRTDIVDNSRRVKYQLVNGNSYDESELIVGSQNIRDSKLNNILKDGI